MYRSRRDKPREPSSSESSEEETNIPLYKPGRKNKFNFKSMMPLMMMMSMNTGGSNQQQEQQRESDIQKKINDMQRRQEKLIEDLIKAKNESEYTSALKNPVMQRLDGLERKLDMMRKNKLKQKEKPGMPKFLMYMQQNLMNQAMLQTHLNDPDPSIDQYPRIVPVAVDPRKRIMPFSTNPFINFEMNKPAAKNKDVNLDFEMINNLLAQNPEKVRGEEMSNDKEESDKEEADDSNSDEDD